MSYRNKNSQLLTAGIIAIATVGLLIYFSSVNDTAKAKTTKKDDAEDTKALAPEPKKTAATTSKKEEKKAATTSDATPKKSNVTDQKELHSKIEELDKKGKALFKSKKVCVYFCASFLFVFHHCVVPKFIVFLLTSFGFSWSSTNSTNDE